MPNGDGRGRLYRISRSTGNEEQWIELNSPSEFAIGGGNVYFTSSDFRILDGVSALDFQVSVEYHRSYSQDSPYAFGSVTFANNRVYTLVNDKTNYGISIFGYDTTLENSEEYYEVGGLTKSFRGNESFWGANSLCALDDHFVFNIGYALAEDGKYRLSKYVVTPSSETNFISNTVIKGLIPLEAGDIYSHCITKTGNNYKVNYYNASDGNTVLFYTLFDKNGNDITNN